MNQAAYEQATYLLKNIDAGKFKNEPDIARQVIEAILDRYLAQEIILSSNDQLILTRFLLADSFFQYLKHAVGYISIRGREQAFYIIDSDVDPVVMDLQRIMEAIKEHLEQPLINSERCKGKIHIVMTYLNMMTEYGEITPRGADLVDEAIFDYVANEQE